MSARNILVLSFTHIGDATLSTCVIAPLREAHPSAKLTFLVGERAAPLMDGEPAIDAVIVHRASERRGLRRRWQLVKELRRRRFDLVVDLRDAAHSRLIGGRRIGLKARGRTHAVARYLDALNRAGIAADGARPTLTISDEERANARNWLASRGVGGSPLIGVHPGGNWTYKLWPAERFATVADSLTARHGARALIFGGPDEQALQDNVIRAMSEPAVAARDVTLRELAALIEACALYVGNDTGPMHIADAVRTPTVVLFEPTDDIRSGPYGDEHFVVRSGLDIGCNPCHPGRRPGGCGKGYCEPLHAITVDQVVRAGKSLMQTSKG